MSEWPPPGGADDREAASAEGRSDMVLRRVKQGSQAGREFWGCSMNAKTKRGGIKEVE